MPPKRKVTSNEGDSGAEDLDQQIICAVDAEAQHDDNDDEEQKQEQQEPPVMFSACDDEGYEEQSAEAAVQDPVQDSAQRLQNDRKSPVPQS